MRVLQTVLLHMLMLMLGVMLMLVAMMLMLMLVAMMRMLVVAILLMLMLVVMTMMLKLIRMLMLAVGALLMLVVLRVRVARRALAVMHALGLVVHLRLRWLRRILRLQLVVVVRLELLVRKVLPQLELLCSAARTVVLGERRHGVHTMMRQAAIGGAPHRSHRFEVAANQIAEAGFRGAAAVRQLDTRDTIGPSKLALIEGVDVEKNSGAIRALRGTLQLWIAVRIWDVALRLSMVGADLQSDRRCEG